MASDEKQPPRGSGDRIEWFTVSYRTLALAGGVRSSCSAALGWFCLRPPHAPAAAAGHRDRDRRPLRVDRRQRAGEARGHARVAAGDARHACCGRTTSCARGSGAAAEIRFADGTRLQRAARQPDHDRGELAEPGLAPAAGGALDPVRGGQLPDRGAQRARQHHDLDADRAHDRASATPPATSRWRRAARPACASSGARARPQTRTGQRIALGSNEGVQRRRGRRGRARRWPCPPSRSSRRPPTGPTSPTRTSRRASRSCCGTRCRGPRPTA